MDISGMSPQTRAFFNVSFVGMIVFLPLLTWYFSIAILHYDAALVWPDATFWSHVAPPTLGSVSLYLLWIGFQALLFAWLPGRAAEGAPLPDGRRLEYRLNGLLALGLTAVVAAGAVLVGWLPGGFLFDLFPALVTTSNLVVLLGCLWLLAFGRRQATDEERRLNWLEAYTVGACRNPRIGSFDLKFFCESRPSMILWVVIDLSLAAKQLELHGSVSNAMALVCFFQVLYVVDYFWFEDAILTTWDIKHENFGFMLGWGCLVWIPFAYSLQPLYLVAHPEPLPVWGAAGIFVLNALGYFIFRTSNLQKHRFSSDPDAAHLGREARVHPDRARQSAAHLGLVGHLAPQQLSGRLADGAVVVAHLRLRAADPLLLSDLLRDPAAPSGMAGWEALCGEVWGGLGSLHEEGSLADRSGDLLSAESQSLDGMRPEAVVYNRGYANPPRLDLLEAPCPTTS